MKKAFNGIAGCRINTGKIENFSIKRINPNEICDYN